MRWETFYRQCPSVAHGERRRSPALARMRRFRRLLSEPLEERCLLSTTVVNYSADDYALETSGYLDGPCPAPVVLAASAMAQNDSSDWHLIDTYEQVPEYFWHYGCSPTAAGMLFGWWDAQLGTTRLFAGSAATWWGDASETASGGTKSLVASTSHIVAGSENGLTYGDWHNSTSYPDHVSHPASLADFMKTYNGGTSRSNMAAGFEAFAAWDCPWTETNESYAADATTYYTSSGWTFADFKAEIDAGYPVHLGITGQYGHSILAVGYWDRTAAGDSGDYGYVCYTTWSGWGLTEWRWDGVDVPYDMAVYGATYLRVYTSSISGQEFNDRDGDGEKDSGEAGLAGWTINLDLNNDGTVDQTTTTDDDGHYTFTDVPVGTHTLSEVAQTGWVQTCPVGSGMYTVTMGTGATLTDIDFGNREFTVPPTISSVGSTTADGWYKTGAIIPITVTFDKVIFVDTTGGTPTLTLETGTVDAVANYSGGSGTTTLPSHTPSRPATTAPILIT